MVNLPNKFEEFADARRQGFLKVKEIKENGGKIAGVFCTFTPSEILDAAGIFSVGLCGMSEETIIDAETDLPKNLCPLIKSSYGFALTEKCPYTYFADIIIGETTCDGKKKMYELLGEIKDTYIMQLPQGVDREYAHKMWESELHRLIKTMEEKFQVDITEEKLRKAVSLRNKQRKIFNELFELSKLDPPPIRGFDVYKVIEGSGFSFDVEETCIKLRELIDNTKNAYEAGDRPVAAEAKRILVTGCPIGGVLDKVVNTIENNGGVVVCFENCGGVKPVRHLVDENTEDIVSAIADRYLKIGCSVMSPNPRRMEMLPELLKEFKIEGVIEVILQTCHPYSVETKTIKELVNDAGLPHMSIETDYSKSDLGQIKTRISAFIEMEPARWL
ncbi:double-cubane-cluster-containing anaerobic reductase [Dehalobacterium formicoaceticum]|uniref:Double-cubane-cluster-containing anaerobic reductase n=1 Tax=Dehalobacterium formicoaceticum TaxID=51515 RepID=A0ABT1Y8T6_9FIRM|nr:double-cubane-cluster-containing anaerobic reductase [Dehalobacterium formicoaceticum]MCR6546505.1 double-cubane-cluster-containing anaerobic reductase [Dehalobacterium formicoaceticum]